MAKRIITLRLTRAEADALMDAGNCGLADLHDAQDEESLDSADVADVALNKLRAAMTAAGWMDETPP